MKTFIVSENGEIPLEAFSEFTDITKVKYYNMTLSTNGTIQIILYDENKEVIKIFEKNEYDYIADKNWRERYGDEK